MKVEEVAKVIEKIAPLEYGEDWDNTGIQINSSNKEVKKILVSMETNEAVIKEAIDLKVDMLVTHHPLIFSKIKSLDCTTVQGKYLIKLINSDISVYSAHLTFDSAPGGNNYYLGELLQLEDISQPNDNPEKMPGIVGTLNKSMTLREFGYYISEKLDIPKHVLKLAGDMDMEIKKVAICSGAGGDLLKPAINDGCNVLITGDTKLHEAQKAIAEGIALIDAGHYDTEKQFVENMSTLLAKECDDIEIIESKAKINPFEYLN